MQRITITLFALALTAACGIAKDKHQHTLDALSAAERARDAKAARIAELETELQSEKAARKNAESRLGKDLRATQADLAELHKKRQEAEKRLAAFRRLTAKFQKMINTGKLKVYTRGGRMIVNLPSGVLFKSGKGRLSRKGKKALVEVAQILSQIGKRRLLVAGHTDNVPISTSRFKDNWDLSAARALAMTKYLIGQGLDPKTLGAAGYGSHDPIGDNDSEEGKAANRRIEIILVPNIDELPTIPEG